MQHQRIIRLGLFLVLCACFLSPMFGHATIGTSATSTIYLPATLMLKPPRRIAFTGVSDYPGTDVEIYVTTEDGSSYYQLTDSQFRSGNPTWSPDARAIAYTRYDAPEVVTPTTVVTITLMISSADGTNQHPIYSRNGTNSIQHPRWSPDGAHIVFSAKQGMYSEIYRIDPDGTNLVQLTMNAADDSEPTWSPDSQRLAFVSMRDGNNELYTMQADGTEQTRLTTTETNESSPVWSPDGRSIAFFRYLDLKVLDLETKTERHIYSVESVYDGAYDLAWDPTGERFAFTLALYRNIFILLLDADGTNSSILPMPPNIIYRDTPQWEPFATTRTVP